MFRSQEGKVSLIQESDLIVEVLQGSEGIVKKYIKGRLLGKGGFAKCYQVTSLQTKLKYAAKIIQKASLNKSKAKQKLTSEIKIHRSLRHQNIVGFEHFFEDADNVYILLQICPNQTLNELLKRRKRLTQIQAQYYLYQIADAVEYIHTQKVIHRDLKLGNLFLSDKLSIKIGDFGLATKISFEGEKRKTMCGTPNYIAPQVLENKKGHSYEVDAWGFGVIAYAILIGRPPFETNDVKLTYSKIKSGAYIYPETVPITERAKSLISNLLQTDPSKRLSLKDALNHEFFTWSKIPSYLPISTLACPPNSNFIKQYQRQIQICEKTEESHRIIEISELDSKEDISRSQHKQKHSLQKVVPLGLHNKQVSSATKLVSVESAQIFGTQITAFLGQKKNQSHHKAIYKYSEPTNSQNLWIMYFQQNPKFGLCYMLNSNAVGMKFNDSTVFISNSHLSKLTYIQFNNKLESKHLEIFGISEVPERLCKKMKIMSHYQKELKLQKSTSERNLTNQVKLKKQKLRYRQNPQNTMKNYVVQYYRTNKAVLFWFNNNDLQVVFQDNSRLQIKKQGKVCLYYNKFMEKRQFQMVEYERQPEEIKRRITFIITITKKLKQKTNIQEQIRILTQKDQQNFQISKYPSTSKIYIKKSQDLKTSLSLNKLPICQKVTTNIPQAQS